MIQDRNFNTFLTRLTPAPKLWIALGLTLSILLIKNFQYSLILGILSIILIIREGHIVLFKSLAAIMLILGLSMYLIHGAMAPNIDSKTSDIAFQIFGINFYYDGFRYASRFYMRIFPLMTSLFLIFSTIDKTDLSVVMINMGLPYKTVFMFVDSFQVIKLLNKDMHQISDAQKARGLQTEGSLIQRFRAFVPILIPVVSNAVFRIQDQAIAMETKGFNSDNEKTVYRELEKYEWDNFVRFLGFSLSILSIIYLIMTKLNLMNPFLTNIY